MRLIANHTITAYTDIVLPDGRKDSDVSDVIVKHGTVTVKFKDGTFAENAGETDADMNSIDWRSPDSFVVIDDDGTETLFEG